MHNFQQLSFCLPTHYTPFTWIISLDMVQIKTNKTSSKILSKTSMAHDKDSVYSVSIFLSGKNTGHWDGNGVIGDNQLHKLETAFIIPNIIIGTINFSWKRLLIQIQSWLYLNGRPITRKIIWQMSGERQTQRTEWKFVIFEWSLLWLCIHIINFQWRRKHTQASQPSVLSSENV